MLKFILNLNKSVMKYVIIKIIIMVKKIKTGRRFLMALINCPECSNQISDKCKACPHCGYPMTEVDISIRQEANVSESVLPRTNTVSPVIRSEEFVRSQETAQTQEHIPQQSGAPQEQPQTAPAFDQRQQTYTPQSDTVSVNRTAAVSSVLKKKLSSAAPKVRSAVAAIPIKSFAVFAVILVAAVIVIQLCIRFFLTPYLSAVSGYVKALNSEDIEDRADIYLLAAIAGDMDVEDYIDENEDDIEEALDWQTELLEDKYGDELKYSYEFVSAYPMTDSSLELIENSLNAEREEPVEVKKGVTATAELTLETEKRTKHETVSFDVIKVDGEWVVSKVHDKNGDYPRLLYYGFGFNFSGNSSIY